MCAYETVQCLKRLLSPEPCLDAETTKKGRNCSRVKLFFTLSTVT